MNVRRLNDQGIERFTAFLDSLSGDAPMPYPSALLTDPDGTWEIQPTIEVEQRAFGSKGKQIATVEHRHIGRAAASNGGEQLLNNAILRLERLHDLNIGILLHECLDGRLHKRVA